MSSEIRNNRYVPKKESKNTVLNEIILLEQKFNEITEKINLSLSVKNFDLTVLINCRNTLSVKIAQAKKKVENITRYGKSHGLTVDEKGTIEVLNFTNNSD
jgi:hypothetical protein